MEVLFSLEEFLYLCHGNQPQIRLCHQCTHNITNINELTVFQIQSFVERNEKRKIELCMYSILLNIRGSPNKRDVGKKSWKLMNMLVVF